MKLLVSPFLWCLLLQLVILRTAQRQSVGRPRAIIRMLWFLSVFLAFFSTPVAGQVLEHTLALPLVSQTVATLEWIFVLGGGYARGAVPEEDTLNLESVRRVLHGISVWRRHPQTHLVFSGAVDYPGKRQLNRHGQLAFELALQHGVPAVDDGVGDAFSHHAGTSCSGIVFAGCDAANSDRFGDLRLAHAARAQ